MCLLLFGHVFVLRCLYFVHCLSSPLVSFLTASVPIPVAFFFSFRFIAPLSTLLIAVSRFLYLLSSFLSPSLTLVSRQWAVCSLLRVDTLAPPRSRHNWPPSFVLVHSTHTRTDKHTQRRESTRRRERETGKGRAKKKKKKEGRQGERKRSGSCRRLGLVSVYC